LQLGSEFKSALLKWEVTPDFYVDVYELKRKGFQFRVDDGKTQFIEIGTYYIQILVRAA